MAISAEEKNADSPSKTSIKIINTIIASEFAGIISLALSNIDSP
jgi:hypothetical protein